jgi:uncharacterized membrane protein YcfT
MSRSISICVLLFWSALFAGMAYLGLGQPRFGADSLLHADQDALLAVLNQHQLMIVMVLLVATLFFWAAMSVAFGEAIEFRNVESTAYCGAIVAVTVALIAGFAKLSPTLGVPAMLVASLAASAAASHWLPVTETAANTGLSQSLARRMAISAAHNSMLSRIGGRAHRNEG